MSVNYENARPDKGKETILRKLTRLDVFDFPRDDADYYIRSSIGENQHPDVVAKAHQIHGVSYVDYGYFDASGLMADGSLVPELDGTRGEASGKRIANYLLATRMGSSIGEASATVRLLDIGDNGTIDDLPTYQYFDDVFDEETKTKLHGIIDRHGKKSIREVAALATTDDGGHRGSFELMRAMIQNSIIKKHAYGHSELYLASLTKQSLRPVLGFVGYRSTQLLGDPVQIFSDDPRSHAIYVTPVLMDLSHVLKGTIQDIEAATTHAEYQKLKGKLRFLSDGLPLEYVDKHEVDDRTYARVESRSI